MPYQTDTESDLTPLSCLKFKGKNGMQDYIYAPFRYKKQLSFSLNNGARTSGDWNKVYFNYLSKGMYRNESFVSLSSNALNNGISNISSNLKQPEVKAQTKVLPGTLKRLPAGFGQEDIVPNFYVMNNKQEFESISGVSFDGVTIPVDQNNNNLYAYVDKQDHTIPYRESDKPRF
jgi:hypothetical protein